jgi:hypothetical protein
MRLPHTMPLMGLLDFRTQQLRRRISLAVILLTLIPVLGGCTNRPVPRFSEDDIIVAQTNIRFDVPADEFKADIATTVASRPDFVSLNEMFYRRTRDLTPDGYVAFRVPGEPPGTLESRSTVVL